MQIITEVVMANPGIYENGNKIGNQVSLDPTAPINHKSLAYKEEYLKGLMDMVNLTADEHPVYAANVLGVVDGMRGNQPPEGETKQ
jgi:hypothetical protein